ncbi:MAG: SusD/RagB family nutrient-binding outer membrane lipoprotein [Saprospiraceae bacterium]
MNLKRFFKYSIFLIGIMISSGACKDYLDINQDPNAVLDAPIEQVYTSATVSVGFFAGSDLNRYSSLIAQQWSGTLPNQTGEYERYNISGTDVNNAWNLVYSTALSDLELVIQKAVAENSPNYAGPAKILKAYLFQLLVDTWGNIPFSEALKFTEITAPKFDDASTIYPALISLLDQAIADINATSVKSPAANGSIFTGSWASQKPKWERLANTLKMRLFLHYSKIDKAKAVAEIGKLTSANVMTSNTDNFQMAFFATSGQQNPIHQFEVNRGNYLFANATIVNMMNSKSDPRRPKYFTAFPLYSGKYVGSPSANLQSNIKFSRLFTFLRGDTTNTAPIVPAADGSISATQYPYNGTAPIRMLTFAEYNFIRAEAAVLGVPGIAADSFYRSGIRASMAMAGVTTAATDAYIGANPFPDAGTDAEKIKAIIEEKYVANFGVVVEPWTDFRRTGYPALVIPSNALFPATPRSLFFPQSEIDRNPNAKQKADPSEKIFWDK